MTSGKGESSVERAYVSGSIEATIDPTKSCFQPKPARSNKSMLPGRSSDFDEIDRQRDCDSADSVFQEAFEIGLEQSTLAELRQRLLLFHAAAQFGLKINPLGDVVAQPEHA